jgi:hypothetical protein
MTQPVNPAIVTSPPDVQNNSGTRQLLDLGSVGIQPISMGVPAPGMSGSVPPAQPNADASGPTGLPAGGQNLGYLVSDNTASMSGSVADGGPSVLATRFQAPGTTA